MNIWFLEKKEGFDILPIEEGLMCVKYRRKVLGDNLSLF